MDMNEGPYRTASFLIVDDDKVAVKTIERAMKSLRIANPTFVAGDGIEALKHLRAAVDESGGALPPYIVLLDLSMPRMTGLEFLEVVRGDSVLSRLVVFVLTTSDAPGDIAAAYRRNVAGYILKEDPSESMREGLEVIEAYSRLVVLP